MRLPERPGTDDGRLAANLLSFCRTLRRAGVPLGPGEVIDALRAAELAGLERREDFYHALRAVLVKKAVYFPLFAQAFHLYFRNPRILERAMALLLPAMRREGTEAAPGAALRRLLEALDASAGRTVAGDDPAVDRSNTWSRQEVLRKKDFEQMSLAELAEAKALLERELAPLRKRPTRRYRPDPAGHRYDLKRSMQLMTRNNGELLALSRKRRRVRTPPVVLLCDISGSMSAYSRMFLLFAHALSSALPRVHTFVFGTRLTNVTRHLAGRDADQSLARISDEVSDWDGGTRIAASLERFNVLWNRRVLGQNAAVILLTDGLERDSSAGLAAQMERLHRSCRDLFWLNPVLRYREFRPLAQGIRAMLPHVDRFLPAHNLQSLGDVCRILHAGAVRDGSAAVAGLQAGPAA